MTTINTFEDLGLKETLLRGIFSYGYEKPSTIQQKAILPILSGKDVIVQAQSGSGKTATFSISALQAIDSSLQKCQVIVLAPTRELATQINGVIGSLAHYMDVSTCECIGGVQTNFTQLRNAQIVVGTPGRVYDLINSKRLKTDQVKLFVLDEADEMLSDDFIENIKEIYRLITCETLQNVILSATLSQAVMDVAEEFMNDPIKILVKNEELTLEGIRQFYINVDNENYKLETMCDLFDTISVSQTVIFVNSKKRAEWLTDMMVEKDFAVTCIHGEMPQTERQETLKNFRAGSARVLIATDILARGIDVQQVSLVVNFDLPNKIENYIHRIGRSGRFGRKGVAINFVTSTSFDLHSNIEKYYGTQVDELPLNIAEHLQG
jgi:superfamily II DNA/RNA helicase